MKKLRIAIAGLGSRGLDTYAQCQNLFPEKMTIAAVSDPRPSRIAMAREQFSLQPEQCFHTAEEMLEKMENIDAVFICTQDRQHVPQAIAALERGCHVLLEKPISPDLGQCRALLEAAKKAGKQVVVCHVLRYTPFYNKLKELIDAGIIGRVMGIQHIENVAYWHQAHSFVRGNWRSSRETSPMIMAKCCHDLDLLLWLTGKHCRAVSSFGDRLHFRRELAPEGAPLRCTDGCPESESCPYDARKIYITDAATGIAAGKDGWPCNILSDHPTEESILEAIRTGPYGRCVYHCDNDVVDHQVVNLQMEDGTALQMTMSAFTAHGGRETNVLGTNGQIRADLHTNTIQVQPFGGEEMVYDIARLSTDLDGHAGGDHRMVEEFLDLIAGTSQPTIRTTSLDVSVESHFAALAAERSRTEGGRSVLLAEIAAG